MSTLETGIRLNRDGTVELVDWPTSMPIACPFVTVPEFAEAPQDPDQWAANEIKTRTFRRDRVAVPDHQTVLLAYVEVQP